MKHLKLMLILLSGLLSLTSLPKAQTITLDEFLDQLKKEHPLFEKERLLVQIEKEQQTGYLGYQDWLITSSPFYTYQKPLATSTFLPDQVEQISLNAGLNRVFWNTGGRLSLSWKSNYTDQNTQDIVIPNIVTIPAGPSQYFQNELAVTYVHPLMRNKNGILDRLQYDLKQYDIDFSEVRAIENQEDFLAAIAGKFLDWVLLTEQKQIIRDRLKLSEGELVRTKKKKEANLVDQVDVIRSQDAVRIAKLNQVLIESQWNGLQAEMAVLIQNNEQFNMRPVFDIYTLQEFGTLEEVTKHLRTSSRLIKTLRIRIDQLGYARKGFEDILKPDLSLVAQFNTKNLDDGFGESLKMDKPDAVIGLQFSVPLGNRTAQSHITKTDIQTTQLKRELDNLTITLISALANLHIQIQEFETVLQLNVEQIESAKKKTEEELKLYEQGRGDLTFVIQSQDSEENAKLNYAGNAVTYQKLIIAYRALLDELL